MKNENGFTIHDLPRNERCITKILFFSTGKHDETNIGLLYRGGPILSGKPQNTDL